MLVAHVSQWVSSEFQHPLTKLYARNALCILKHISSHEYLRNKTYLSYQTFSELQFSLQPLLYSYTYVASVV